MGYFSGWGNGKTNNGKSVLGNDGKAKKRRKVASNLKLSWKLMMLGRRLKIFLMKRLTP